MTGLDTIIREVIRDEIRRLVRADALALNHENVPTIDPEEEIALTRRAAEVASRFRRARSG